MLISQLGVKMHLAPPSSSFSFPWAESVLFCRSEIAVHGTPICNWVHCAIEAKPEFATEAVWTIPEAINMTVAIAAVSVMRPTFVFHVVIVVAGIYIPLRSKVTLRLIMPADHTPEAELWFLETCIVLKGS